MNDLPQPTSISFQYRPSSSELETLSPEYKLISSFYGERRANRSQVPLMNHIIEGIAVLKYINSSTQAKAAFCLHPLLQADSDLLNNYHTVHEQVNADVVVLAIEYRSVANEYLSHRSISSIEEIRLSPLREVNDMLVADKVQNYKDFILYHHGTHPRSMELHQYFRNWITRLDCVDVMDTFLPHWHEYEVV